MQHVRISPSQSISGTDEAVSFDLSASSLPDQGNAFYISFYNSSENPAYFVTGSATVSGLRIAGGESLTIGPLLKDDAENVDIYCDGAVTGSVTFTSILSER